MSNAHRSSDVPRLAPVTPDAKVRLTDEAAASPHGTPDKDRLEKELGTLVARLDELQHALYAEGRHALLVVLQGRDTAGKDGVIRHVFGPLDAQGVTVTGFKVPTPLELRHDFLWRVHAAVPPTGLIGVFNRSHYEDVLVVRVHELVPESVWRPRFEQIVDFEKMLAANRVAMLKFFLHISRDEQRDRLLDRLDEPDKYWKFSVGDLGERERWDAYTAAYEEALVRTSTAEAPWYVVPADNKHLRDVLVARVVVDALERLNPKYPGPPEGIERLRKLLR